MSDVLSIHPYWMHNIGDASKGAYEKKLDDDVAFANRVKKPILATECCWGSLNDAVRVESVRYGVYARIPGPPAAVPFTRPRSRVPAAATGWATCRSSV